MKWWRRFIAKSHGDSSVPVGDCDHEMEETVKKPSTRRDDFAKAALIGILANPATLPNANPTGIAERVLSITNKTMTMLDLDNEEKV